MNILTSRLDPVWMTAKEHLSFSLSDQQKKIIAIALLAFSCLALCYFLCSGTLQATESKENLSDQDVIYFYNKGERYYELTNFYENWRKDGLHYIRYQGEEWKTSEHAFQAEKFNWDSEEAQEVRQQIISAPSASVAFKIAQQNKHLMRSDWHQIKDNIMLDILRCKFSDDHLSNVLKKTGSRSLVENSPTDSYWGCGNDGEGLNRLGILLMQVRKERFHLE